jgi:hypothetical protein
LCPKLQSTGLLDQVCMIKTTKSMPPTFAVDEPSEFWGGEICSVEFLNRRVRCKAGLVMPIALMFWRSVKFFLEPPSRLVELTILFDGCLEQIEVGAEIRTGLKGEFLADGGQDWPATGETLSRRSRRNRTLAVSAG